MNEMDRPFYSQIWFQAIRVPVLTTSVIGVLLGSSFAAMDRAFHPTWFSLTLLAALLIQAGTHLLSDYFEYKNGRSARDSLASSGVLQRAWLRPRTIVVTGLILYGISLLPIIYLSWVISPIILWTSLFAIFLGIGFTGGPLPLDNHSLGEFVVFLVMGPILIGGTYFVQVGWIRPGVLLGSVPIGLLAASILHLAHMRDRDFDKKSGKNTLATILSFPVSRIVFSTLLLGAYVVHVILVGIHAIPAWSLLSFVTLPFAWKAIRQIYLHTSSAQMNLLIGNCIFIQILYGVIYTLGLLIETFIT